MSQINATMVKSLRDRTGAGMMDCKNALVETAGDEEKAVEIIRKKGLAKVAKKAGAIAAEGVVHAYIHPGNRLGVLLELNCQTDFVARNEEFVQLADALGMQIASMTPLYVRRDDIPQADIDAQRAFFKEQMDEEASKSGKTPPPQAIDKILDGKINKWISESCLVDQPSIVNGDQNIQQCIDELTAKLGEKISIRRFVRFELGEGIVTEKKDLAAEVAETLKGS